MKRKNLRLGFMEILVQNNDLGAMKKNDAVSLLHNLVVPDRIEIKV